MQPEVRPIHLLPTDPAELVAYLKKVPTRQGKNRECWCGCHAPIADYDEAARVATILITGDTSPFFIKQSDGSLYGEQLPVIDIRDPKTWVNFRGPNGGLKDWGHHAETY